MRHQQVDSTGMPQERIRDSLYVKGERIHRSRSFLHWTQAQLGARAGYSEKTIRDMEKSREGSRTRFARISVECVAQALGLNLDDLIASEPIAVQIILEISPDSEYEAIERRVTALLRDFKGVRVVFLKRGSIRIGVVADSEDSLDAVRHALAREFPGASMRVIPIKTHEELDGFRQVISQQELDVLLNQHERWVRGDSPEQPDFSGLDLSGLRMPGRNLVRAKFGVRPDWPGTLPADLSEADLSGADLTEAYMAGVKLRGANLCETRLTGADLSDVELTNSNISLAELDASGFLQVMLPSCSRIPRLGIILGDTGIDLAGLQSARLQPNTDAESVQEWVDVILALLRRSLPSSIASRLPLRLPLANELLASDSKTRTGVETALMALSKASRTILLGLVAEHKSIEKVANEAGLHREDLIKALETALKQMLPT